MEGTFALDPPPPRNFHCRGFLSHPLPHPLVRLGTLSKEYYLWQKCCYMIFLSHTLKIHLTSNFVALHGRGGGGGGGGMDIFWNYTLLKSPLSIICIVFLV